MFVFLYSFKMTRLLEADVEILTIFWRGNICLNEEVVCIYSIWMNLQCFKYCYSLIDLHVCFSLFFLNDQIVGHRCGYTCSSMEILTIFWRGNIYLNEEVVCIYSIWMNLQWFKYCYSLIDLNVLFCLSVIVCLLDWMLAMLWSWLNQVTGWCLI